MANEFLKKYKFWSNTWLFQNFSLPLQRQTIKTLRLW